MRLPFRKPPDILVSPLGAGSAREVSTLHQEGFARPWGADEFAELMAQDTVFGFAARVVGQPRAPMAGFVLARLAADEAEILSIAVARQHRGGGIGRSLMEAVMRRLYAQRAEALFLEVDETNLPAVALYRRLGFREVGRRTNYYAAGDGTRTSALVMRRDLR